MLVEDEKVVAADIEECVRGLGYSVVGSAASGTEALRLAVKTRPDLALMDIKLKGSLDGVDVAAALREQLRIPVVYLTAYADSGILERARKTAPAGYVLKPFDERSLRAAIEIALDRFQRETDLAERGERLAAAIGSIDDALIVTGETGCVAVMNRAAEMLTGWTQAQAIGKPVREVFTLLDARNGSPLASPVGRAFREGISIGLGDDSVLLSSDGRRTPILGSATPVRNGEQPAGVCLLFRAAGQRTRDENWGSPDHMRARRLEILGRLTAAVAQQLTGLLAAGRGRTRALQLANRLLAFGQPQPAASGPLDLNELIAGTEDLLRCALGDDIDLSVDLGPDTGIAKGHAGLVELLLMSLALSARDSGARGRFSLETREFAGETTGDTYAALTIRAPGAGWDPATDLPALDEIARQSEGEMRVFTEDGAVKVFLPKAGPAARG
jgi:PAS domain S-box-containing protein